VITSFSHQGGPAEAGDLKLKVYRPTVDPAEYTVVGSAQMTMGANQLTTAPAHIPVQAGDTLGYARLAGSTMRCLFSTANATDVVRDAPGNDTADLGTTSFNPPAGSLRINISAVLEPDNDSDGLGDETEDMDDDNDGVADGSDSCPTTAGAGANGCAPAVTPLIPSVTPTPTTPRKKCKKRRAASDGAAVARKKCRKRRK
jgi:hypothetical protein